MSDGIEFIIDMDVAKKEAERQVMLEWDGISFNKWNWLIKERTKVLLLDKENKELKQTLEIVQNERINIKEWAELKNASNT